MVRCQVTSEKSSKNYISLFCGKPARGLPTPPPTSPQAVTAHFTHGGRQVRTASARFTCENHSREGGGGGRVICKTVPFNNGSSDWLQTQNQDSQYYSAPLLFRQDLSISYWWLLASFGKFIQRREAIKGSPEPVASPQSTTLRSTVNTSVKEGSRPQQHTWNSKALFFPTEILLHIVYIFNILCGLKVIDSRHLQ